MHDGAIDTLFRFMSLEQFDFSGLGGDPARRDIEAFLMAYESNLAPIVGQQVSADRDSIDAAGPRIDLLIARAGAPIVVPGGEVERECDLVVSYANASSSVSYLLEPDGLFHPDRGRRSLDDGQLRRRVRRGGTLTYTCVPFGSGRRIALDRDRDGVRDGEDVCPAVAESEQADRDHDGVGDACDDCPDLFDPFQTDLDADGRGDLCQAPRCGRGYGLALVVVPATWLRRRRRTPRRA
jgi:hypothetical protein